MKVDQVISRLGLEVLEGAVTGETSVVEDQPEAVISFDRGRHPIEVLGPGQVRPEDVDRHSVPGGQRLLHLLQALATPGDQDQVISARGQRRRKRRPDSRRRAGYERSPTAFPGSCH